MKKTRNSPYFGDHYVVTFLLSEGLLQLGAAFGILSFLPYANQVSTNPVLETLADYVAYSGIWVLFVSYIILFQRNRYMLKKISLRNAGNSFKNALIGLLIGFFMNGLCILCAACNQDLSFAYTDANASLLLAGLIAIFIQSSAEELVFRVFAYQRYLRRYGPCGAIVITSVCFAVTHLANPGMNLVAFFMISLSGLMFAAMIYYCDSFLMATMAHTAWNFTQTFLFGLPNSGYVPGFSLFRMTDNLLGISPFYDSTFGIEGSVMAVFVQAFVLILFVLICECKKRRHRKRSREKKRSRDLLLFRYGLQF